MKRKAYFSIEHWNEYKLNLNKLKYIMYIPARSRNGNEIPAILKWLVTQKLICRVYPISKRFFRFITCTFNRLSLQLFRFKIYQFVPFCISFQTPASVAASLLFLFLYLFNRILKIFWDILVNIFQLSKESWKNSISKKNLN